MGRSFGLGVWIFSAYYSSETIYLRFNIHSYLNRPERDYFLGQNRSEVIILFRREYPHPRYELAALLSSWYRLQLYPYSWELIYPCLFIILLAATQVYISVVLVLSLQQWIQNVELCLQCIFYKSHDRPMTHEITTVCHKKECNTSLTFFSWMAGNAA